jgi:hypothetical protein
MAARGITSVPLPPPPDGYYADRYQVGVDGRLFGLFSTFDTKGAVRRFRTAQKSNPAVYLENIPAGAEGLVAVAVGAGWRPLVSFPFTTYAYVFDVAPDDFCVVARRDCRTVEASASAFLDGVKVLDFYAGDAITDLQCDSRNGIWTCYSDEAFGNTLSGIVRFSRDGAVSSYLTGDVMDCYALNAGRDATWACWHTDFPLIRLDDNCAEQRWSNDIAHGVHAVAVAPPYALLVSPYDDRNKLALVRLHGDRVHLVQSFDAPGLLGEDLRQAWFTARNDCLFVAGAARVHTLPVSHLVEA